MGGRSPREDYIRLYVDTVREVARAEDPSRDFMVSRCQQSSFPSLQSTFQRDSSSPFSSTTSPASPSNGLASDAAGFIADNPYSSLWGDTHYYNYR